MKDWILTKLYHLIGYPSNVQAMLDHIDSYESDVVVYPHGEFAFGIKTSDGDEEPMIFPTPQERAAFGAGMSHGVALMGGQTAFLTDQQMKEYEEMEASATIRSDPKKVN